MSFWRTDVYRIFLATTLSYFLGALYHNPALNPFMTTWMELTYPGISDPRTVNDPTLPLIGTAVCLLLIATIINRYVNYRQLSNWRLVIMAVELWLLTILFQMPKALFGNESLKLFAINHGYDLLVALTMAFALGYKRFPEVEVIHTYNTDYVKH